MILSRWKNSLVMWIEAFIEPSLVDSNIFPVNWEFSDLISNSSEKYSYIVISLAVFIVDLEASISTMLHTVFEST